MLSIAELGILGAIALALIIAIVVVFRRAGEQTSGVQASGRNRPASSGVSSGPSAASGPKYNWFVGESGDVEGKSFHVGKRTATIGRGIGNFIQIADENSSRVHAQFVGSPSGLKIKDMGSSNGTLVNDDKLDSDEFRRLEDGDRVSIGDTTFVYYRTGDFRDEALTGSKDLQAHQQKQTMAFGAVGGPGGGDLKTQIERAVEEADGDYEKAAQKVGLDAELVQKIVEDEG